MSLFKVQEDAQSGVEPVVGNEQVRKRDIRVHLQHLSRWAEKLSQFNIVLTSSAEFFSQDTGTGNIFYETEKIRPAF